MFQSEWMAQGDALKALCLSRTQFWRLRRAGIFKPGSQYVRSSRSRRAPLIVNVEACRLAQRVHLGH